MDVDDEYIPDEINIPPCESTWAARSPSRLPVNPRAAANKLHRRNNVDGRALARSQSESELHSAEQDHCTACTEATWL